MRGLLGLLLIVGAGGCVDDQPSLSFERHAGFVNGVGFGRVVSFSNDSTVKGQARPGTAKPKSSKRVSSGEWLRVVGKQIRTSPSAAYYPADQVFLGMGVAHPRTSQLPYGSDEPVARFARERHCNILRITTHRPGEGGPSDVDKFIAWGDEQVRICKKHRIYSILDWYHQSGYKFLVHDRARFDAWKDFWIRVARYYRDDPWVIFEILNEPIVDQDEWLQLRDRIADCIRAIRATEGTRKHLVLVGGNRWCNSSHISESWDGFNPDPARMTAIVFHDYSESTPEKTARNIDEFQKNNEIPVFGSEWGIKPGLKGAGVKECREQEIGMLDKVYLPRKISECFWSLSGNGGFLEQPENPWKSPGPGTPLHDCIPFSDIWIPRTIENASRCRIVVHPEISASAGQIAADGVAGSTIALEIKDQANWRIEYNDRAKDSVLFSTSHGNLEGTNPVTGLATGTAKVVLKSGRPGTADVAASYSWNAALWQYTAVDSYVSRPSFGYWKAVDGRIFSESRIARDKYKVSASKSWHAKGPGPHWLVVDLGAAYTVGRFVVHHDGADAAGGNPQHNTSDFQIQRGSTLGGPWKDLARVKGNTDSVTTHTIAPVKMRYVRLYITGAGQTDDPTARICEFEVYATARVTIQVKVGKSTAPILRAGHGRGSKPTS